MFTFKINHHILYNRDKLFKAKLIMWPVRQTLEHLFVNEYMKYHIYELRRKV